MYEGVELDIVRDLVNVAELTPTFGPSDLDHYIHPNV